MRSTRNPHRTAALLAALTCVLVTGCTDDVCPGLTSCGGTCADLQSSPANCGACGHACAVGEACVEGACVSLSCTDECPELGALGCAPAPRNGLMVCVDFADTDPCLEWGGYTACQEGETCDGGVCTGGCADECEAEGATACDGDGYRECGQHDADSCRVWSDVIPCEDGETCSLGVCSSEPCTDECEEGARACHDDAVRTCGQHDGDPCLEWSADDPCAEGETCVDGRCEARQCTEEHEDCVCGEDECCEGHCCPVFFICIYSSPDEDFCPFGEGPNG
jgi:hypothetical protein